MKEENTEQPSPETVLPYLTLEWTDSIFLTGQAAPTELAPDSLFSKKRSKALACHSSSSFSGHLRRSSIFVYSRSTEELPQWVRLEEAPWYLRLSLTHMVLKLDSKEKVWK